MPLIVVLVLISIIAVICVGAPFGRPQENAEISKDVEANKEEILAETDIAATSVGTNVKATFTASTGEVHIYSTSGIGTINKTNWSTFFKKIYNVDNNLNAVKIITFDNQVNAPKDSSLLLSAPVKDDSFTHFEELISINNIGYLNTSNVTNIHHCCSAINIPST